MSQLSDYVNRSAPAVNKPIRHCFFVRYAPFLPVQHVGRACCVRGSSVLLRGTWGALVVQQTPFHVSSTLPSIVSAAVVSLVSVRNPCVRVCAIIMQVPRGQACKRPQAQSNIQGLGNHKVSSCGPNRPVAGRGRGGWGWGWGVVAVVFVRFWLYQNTNEMCVDPQQS